MKQEVQIANILIARLPYPTASLSWHKSYGNTTEGERMGVLNWEEMS